MNVTEPHAKSTRCDSILIKHKKQEQLVYGIRSQEARTGGDCREEAPAAIMFSFSTPVLATQTRGKLVKNSPHTHVPFSLRLLCISRF